MNTKTKEIIKQVAEKNKINELEVARIFQFQRDKIKELIEEYTGNNLLEQIKIPYIGTLMFNKKHYAKFKEKKAAKEELKNQSGLLGADTI